MVVMMDGGIIFPAGAVGCVCILETEEMNGHNTNGRRLGIADCCLTVIRRIMLQ